jgi:cell division protein FtsB
MKRKWTKIEFKRFFIIALLGVFALLMMDLNSRLWDLTRLSTERDEAITQVYEQRATKSVLETRIAYGNSEAAVEDWARGEAGWAKPGDQVIIPLAKTERIITPTTAPTPTTEKVDNWQVWWALFFSR